MKSIKFGDGLDFTLKNVGIFDNNKNSLHQTQYKALRVYANKNFVKFSISYVIKTDNYAKNLK